MEVASDFRMIKVKDAHSSLLHVQNAFKKNKRIFYSRFGDGDVYIMMGRDQANHKVSDRLTHEMVESFQINHLQYLKGLAVNHPVEKGMVRGLFAVFRDDTEMRKFLEKTFGSLEDHVFENPVFLHYLSVFKPQLVNNFLNETIRPKRKMFIGSISKEKMETIIGPIHHYIAVPPKNAYATIQQWWPEILRNIKDVELIIPAAGMATRVINKRLWEMDLEVQSFDIGSLVDVADARQSRKWIRLAGHRIERYIIHQGNHQNLLETFSFWKKELYLLLYSTIKRYF